jgi:putative heme-binding domain-containing protein
MSDRNGTRINADWADLRRFVFWLIRANPFNPRSSAFHCFRWNMTFLLATIASGFAAAAPLELKKGDHICLIGNTLADRMQHDGWLETFLQSRFPRYELVVRNLGFSGDELTVRLRSADFGDPDHWLTFNRADVIFAFFGYNESFAGSSGLDKFKRDLDDFVKHTLSRKYNGKSPPRLVLFSPIAHENLRNSNLPDGKDNNQRLELYTKAMAEIAAAKHVLFVDLFQPSLELYTQAPKPLTINGIHLTEYGNWLLAHVIDRELLPYHPDLRRDRGTYEKLRQAVLEKNFFWFNRYRTMDGYSIYGGRADLEFVDRQTNRVVMAREMEILDVMTANRDKRIWAAAQGRDLHVDDQNTPPFIPVKTNKPGPGPNGAHVFLDGEQAIPKMTVAQGMKVNLFASEKDFPELAKPVQMAFDTKGRLWVAVWPSYPHWKPKEEMNDKLLVLEDTDGDGKADRCTVFADHLHCPTGFAFYNGGVLVAQAPGVLFLKDTDGDGKADLRLRVLDGIDSADTHHTANSFATDPGGAIYFQEGTFHHTQVETPYGPPQRCANAGVFRYEPRTQKFEVYVTYPFANPHGHVFDRWGQDFVYDGTGAKPYHAALFSGYMEYPHKHADPPQVYRERTRPCPGVEILSSRHFPETNQGNLLVANVIGFQGILQYKLGDKGSSFAATEVEPIVSSTDPNFRPSDIKIGADGAIYFLDWQNPIIGHMQHNLRDPSRDRTHGRIYRVTYEGRPLLKPATIDGAPIENLLELLKSPENPVRHRARLELGTRDTDRVMAAVEKWTAGLDESDPAYEHHLMEALWVHQQHNVVDLGLLRRMLQSADFHARAAATRVLCYWRNRVPDALRLLKTLAADSHPRVRLETVRAASFFTGADAVEVALITSEHPGDVYLNFTRDETLKTLEPYLKAMLSASWIAKNEAASRFLLHRAPTDELLKMKRDRLVYEELLDRPGIRDEFRQDALAGLAKLQSKPEIDLLLALLRDHDESNGYRGQSVVFDLARLLTGRGETDLKGFRRQLEKFVTDGKRRIIRQIGFVALVAADGNADAAWELATQSTDLLTNFLEAMPLFRDPVVRASLYPRVAALLDSREGVVRRAAMNAVTYVRGQETATFKALARCIRDDIDRHTAILAVERIPATYWPAEDAEPLLESVVRYIRKLPALERTSPAALEAMHLGDALAGLLPLDRANRMRKELGGLGVRIIRLGTVPDQMLFDKERLVVKAGKPIEIIFENYDLMPHNFVLTQPGALEEVGQLAETSATQPGALERHYVPASNKILFASRLLQPRDSQKLRFTPPVQPGVYPFVCTYPGHWRRMYGAMYVVEDVDEYLADAEGYLAKHPLPPKDELLKFLRPRKEWKLDELAPSVEQLDHGRSFTSGKQIFQAASCVACHRMNGDGYEIGPDLTKLDAKLTAVDILRDILEPSFRINDKYQSYVFETKSGKTITGLILEETATTVKITENPLAKSEPVILKKPQIESRQKSPTSIMPKGLMDKLTREEILDLVAYITARGDPHHRLFQGEHAHAHGSPR